MFEIFMMWSIFGVVPIFFYHVESDLKQRRQNLEDSLYVRIIFEHYDPVYEILTKNHPLQGCIIIL